MEKGNHATNGTVHVRDTGLTWQQILDVSRMTQNKPPSKKPVSPDWIKKLIRSEHSPLRAKTFFIQTEMPYWVAMHFRTHHIGVTWFISSSRTDLTGKERDPNAIVKVACVINAVEVINISRARLCKKASQETREVWRKILYTIHEVEPMLIDACVPNCLHLGRCVEFNPCGGIKPSDWSPCY